jgi:hypothetical protein
MEIRWNGQNSFTIKEGKVRVVLDPNENSQKDLTLEDVVITTGSEKIKGFKGKVYDWPGEYETKGVLVYSLPTEYGENEQRVLSFELEGIRICNIGKLKKSITNDQIGELGNVDILIVPVTLKTKDIVDLVEEVDPKMVILSMVGEPETTLVADVLKEVGQEGLLEEEKIVIKTKADLDSENIVYKLLSAS